MSGDAGASRVSGVPAGRCASCGRVTFPWGLLCPACGGREYLSVRLSRGTVEQTTTVHPRDGGEPIVLALVGMGQAGDVLARARGSIRRGEEVALCMREGRIEAAPIGAGATSAGAR